MMSTLNQPPDRGFRISVCGLICLIGLLLLPTAVSAAGTIAWINADDGTTRGVVLETDLAAEPAAWQLWGNGAGDPPLASIDRLCPNSGVALNSGVGPAPSPVISAAAGDPVRHFAVNGGFWNKHDYPVGVCAGERGIHSARSHRWGFAIAGGRAWIGSLKAEVVLIDHNTSAGQTIAFNPWPLPERSPYLIDPRAYPHSLDINGGAGGIFNPQSKVVWLDVSTSASLRFNTVVSGTVRRAETVAGSSVTSPPPGTLLWVMPDGQSDAPPVGSVWDLSMTLEPVEGVVQLATCAGPMLVEGGELCAGFASAEDASTRRNYRTAVGTDATGRRLWIIVLARGRDGRPGATLRETALTLLDLGATDALNLDGGRSTTVRTYPPNPQIQTLFPLRTRIHHALFSDLVPTNGGS